MVSFVEALAVVARSLPDDFVRLAYSSPSVAASVVKYLDDVLAKHELESSPTIAIGPLAGLTFASDLRRQKYFWLGTFEPWVQEAIKVYAKPGTNLWDIGAFTGFHTLLMCKITGASRVVAVEPDRENRLLLARNLTQNGFGDVEILDCAIINEVGRATLHRTPNSPSQSKVFPFEQGEIQTSTLDQMLMGRSAPSLVKIDVEGAEALTLAGSRNLLNVIRPVWVVEIHGDTGGDVIATFNAANYEIRRIDNWVPEASELVGGGSQHILAIPG